MTIIKALGMNKIIGATRPAFRWGMFAAWSRNYFRNWISQNWFFWTNPTGSNSNKLTFILVEIAGTVANEETIFKRNKVDISLTPRVLILFNHLENFAS